MRNCSLHNVNGLITFFIKILTGLEHKLFLFIPFMIYSLIIEIYTLATTTDYYGVVSRFQDTVALNTIQASILLIIDVMFPLVITIIE